VKSKASLRGGWVSLVMVGDESDPSLFAGAESADRTKSNAALRWGWVSLVMVGGESDPSLRALSLPTE
jgi:hypothetical protein